MRLFTCIIASLACWLCACASQPGSQSGSVIVPPSIPAGARIALISPASCIETAVVDGAIAKLRAMGYEPVPMPNVYGCMNGSYTASDSARAADIMQAFLDPSIDAILCTRGGYGSARLIPYLDAEAIAAHPKWLIGYSDITSLHAFLGTQANMATIHGPMCAHIHEHKLGDKSVDYLFSLLRKGPEAVTYSLEPNKYNQQGSARGRLVGGNVLVACGLLGTPYDVLDPAEGDDCIIFFEDVNENIQSIERFLVRMHYSGALARVKGLIFGEFTKYKPDSDFASMEDMISTRLAEWGYTDLPVLFLFPAGHGEPNYPLPFGVEATLEITPAGSTLAFGDD